MLSPVPGLWQYIRSINGSLCDTEGGGRVRRQALQLQHPGGVLLMPGLPEEGARTLLTFQGEETVMGNRLCHPKMCHFGILVTLS